MIQLATAPNAGQAFRPEGGEKGAGRETQRRSGHAWPFLSRYAARPAQDPRTKPAGAANGS